MTSNYEKIKDRSWWHIVQNKCLDFVEEDNFEIFCEQKFGIFDGSIKGTLDEDALTQEQLDDAYLEWVDSGGRP